MRYNVLYNDEQTDSLLCRCFCLRVSIDSDVERRKDEIIRKRETSQVI